MSRWLTTLNSAWDELARVSPIARQYRSKALSAEDALEIRAAIRATDDAPCLILQTELPPDALFELSGMRLTSVPAEAGSLLVLSLEDSRRRDLFATICADVVDAASGADRSTARAQFLARLDAWRQFLRELRASLSRPEVVGLIGELLVLQLIVSSRKSLLSSWKAPFDGLHDFHLDGHSLEVKTSLGPASLLSISRLDQLDTSGLRRLSLMHVRLVESPTGCSLQEIITSMHLALADDFDRREFENMLLRRGLLPGDESARNALRVQLRTMDTYEVIDGFPRLLRAGLPPTIAEASYSIEIRGIAPFALDTATMLDEFHRGALR